MLKKWFSFDLFGTKESQVAYRNMISEAKEAGFRFRVYKRDKSSTDLISAKQVEIDSEKVEFQINDEPLIIPFSELREVQTLPKTKIVNLILSPNTWSFLASMIPLFLAALVLGFSEELAPLISKTPDYIEGFGFALAIGAMFYYIYGLTGFVRAQESMRMQAVSAGGIRRVIKRLEEASDEEEYFSRLIQVNLKNIEDYYNLVQKQSDKSYRLTQGGAIAGFGVLVIGIALSFIEGMNQTSTALTIASGTLIEFISAVFFYLYNKTVQQLSNYHDKLIKVQDTMLALRVAQGIKNNEELKNETMKYLTEALTSGLFDKTRSKLTASQEEKDK